MTVNNTFILANRAYFDAKIQLRSCMEDILHAEIEKIDFTKTREAADHINTFVFEITKGTIKKLVSPEDVNGAKLVLANAAYFKGAWQYIFDKRHTKPSPFTGLDNTRYTVDMMEQYGQFRYAYNEEIKAEVIELPYSGQSISMLLFKPFKNSQSDFNSMVQGLSMSKFEEIVGKLAPTKTTVKIPKFKLETTCGNDLLQALNRMGLTDPFDMSKADFTTFTLERQISLDKSIHKAFIDVNEEGTEAAAATATVAVKIGGGPTPFECNSPFVFVIRDRDTKNLLFMGAYKSSDKIDLSNKPVVTDKFFPEQDKVNTDVHNNPSAIDSRKDGEIVPTIIKRKEIPKPINQGQGGSNFAFSRDLFPTPSPPAKEGSSNPEQINPSFGDNRGTSSGKEFIPSSGSDQNKDRIFPTSEGNNELIPGRSVNSNPNLNNPSLLNQGDNRGYYSERRNNQNPEQNIPFLEGNRGDGRRSNSSRRNNQSPEQNIPFLGENRGDGRRSNSSRRNNQSPEQNIPFLGENRGDGRRSNSERRRNQNPEQSIPFLEGNREDAALRPTRITPLLGKNSGNINTGRSNQGSSEASDESRSSRSN